MEPEFWHEAWRQRRLGFHLPTVQPLLERLWPELEVPDGGRVLVPLCGKTLDLGWLVDEGHPVLGVELSGVACAELFAERGVSPGVASRPPFAQWSHGDLVVWQGDVFHLPDALDVVALYDRAATVALPPDLRSRYADTLARVLPPGARGLLLTFDYPRDERGGPPFSVPEAEVRRLYGEAFELDRLLSEDDAALAGHLGVSRARHEAWALRRKGGLRAGVSAR